MALNDILGRVLRPLGLAAAVYGCGGEERQGCQDDYDCREPRVCVQGYCEGPGGNGNQNSNRDKRYSVCERICADAGCLEDFDYNFHPGDPTCTSVCSKDLLVECSSQVLDDVSHCLDVKDEQGRYCNDPWVECLDKIPAFYDCARL